MKKVLFILSAFLLLTSCNSDDDSNEAAQTIPQSFALDNNNYSMIGFQGITEARMVDVYTFNDVPYTRSTISLIGMMGFAQTATVSFDLYYKSNMPLAGTYTIFDDVDNDDFFDDFLEPLERGCMGWTSMGVVFQNSGGSNQLHANNPSGTVTVTVNNDHNYTIQYNGNFKLYDDDLNFVRNVPSSVNITGEVQVYQQ